MNDPNDMVSYDIFANNESIYQTLNMSKDELQLDLYGMTKEPDKRYLLSPRVFNYKIVNAYGLAFRPIELNVIKGIAGNNLYLYDTSVFEKNKRKERNKRNELLWYYLYAFYYAELLHYSIYRYKQAVIKHMKQWLKK